MNHYLLSIMKGQRTGWIAQLIIFILLPFSWIYGLGVLLHQKIYRFKGSYKATKPVISIGNITVGGVGKTPLVIYLARLLKAKGLQPVILTRGYMPTSASKSDEADMLIEQIPQVPVLAGADRISNIKNAQGVIPSDVYLCDDALQHWPLERDLNIVAIDAGNPFGNGHLLPAGILREPLKGLLRADVFVLTKINASSNNQILASKLKEINARALIVESRYKSGRVIDVFDGEVLPDHVLRGKAVIGFCAIGDPSSFEAQLHDNGLKVSKLFTFMDHYVYQKEDIQTIVEYALKQDVQVLVTTHKDAVKLRAFKKLFIGIRLVYIPIQLEITKGADEFIQKVLSVCRH